MNRTGSKILHGLLLATSGLVGSTIIASTAAMAGGPTGGHVAVGSATIVNASPTQTVINQSSKKALINWNSFSVSSGSSVQFNQPNSKSLTVNRVTGADASVINGTLQANGNVWLLNANGVLFGKGSQVNVGSLLATTSDISDDDFKNGNYTFKPSANGNASVVNKGTITVGQGGSVVLSAPQVSNEGVIQANLGTVVLGGAKAFTVDITGDNLLTYQITEPVSDAPKSANGSVANALVSNSGTIMATGGHVLMTARAARNVEDNVINNTGMVEATTVSSHNGIIDLDAGPDGTANNSGTLNVSGAAPGQTGGAVNVTGGTVNIADGAKIDASGNAGGGTVRIGGGLHGQGALAHAQATNIGKATISADATNKGNGGTVAVWSDGNTRFAGNISARGGAKGGNGGQVETSGHTLGVAPSARVDTSAPLGLTGDWLLDPETITITANGQDPYDSTNTAVSIDPSAITGALNSTAVTLQATGGSASITVNNDIEYSSGNALSLLSQGIITVNANIQNSGSGAVNLVAGWDTTSLDFSGTIDSSHYGNSGGDITINGNSIAIGSVGGRTVIAGDDISLNAVTGYAQIGYHDASGGDILVLAKSALSLAGGSNTTIAQIGNGGTTASGDIDGDITIIDSGSLQMTGAGGIVAIGNIGGGGSSSQSGNIQIDAGSVALSAPHGQNQGPEASIVQIGNWSADWSSGSATGEIDITSTGGLSMSALGDSSRTIIGNGGSYYNESGNEILTSDAAGGNITVHAGGVAITAGDNGNGIFPFTQSRIGQRSRNASSGDIDVAAIGDANVTIAIAANGTDLASIGHGISAATATSTGNITVSSDGTLSITGNDSGQARIANGYTADSNISVTAHGTISLSVNGDNGYFPSGAPAPGQAFIGNFGNGQAATVGGNISVTSTNGGVSLSANEDGAFVGIGNTGGGTTTTGKVLVSALSGTVSLSSEGGVASGDDENLGTISYNALVEIGNNSGTGNVSGDVEVNASQLTIAATATNATAVLGLFDEDSIGSQSGNITVNVSQSMSVGASGTNSIAQVGNWSDVGTAGGATGTINITVANGLNLSATGDLSHAVIGHGGAFTSNGLTGGDIIINAGTIEVSASDDTSFAQASIGNRGFGQVVGDLDIETTSGDITITAHNSDLASIGNRAAGTVSSSGNITVVSAGGLTITGEDTGQARIAGGLGSNTNIDITAAGNILLTVTGNPDDIGYGTQSGMALIGNFGNLITDSGGDIHVTSTGGGISLDAEEDGGQVAIGNGTGLNATHGNVTVTASDVDYGDIELDAEGENALVRIGNSSPAGTIGGDIAIEAGKDLTLHASANGTIVQIGNGSLYDSDYSGGNITGNINVTVAGWLEVDAEQPSAIAQIGNGDPQAARAGNVAGDIQLNLNGDADFNDEGSDSGDARIWNTATSGYTATGNLTVISPNDLEIDGNILETALQNENVFLGYTGGDTELDGFTYNGSHTLSIAATGDIDIYGITQNDGSGAINIVAGWDGYTIDPSSLTTAGVYGNGNGSIYVSAAFGDQVAIGSKSGITTLAAHDISINAGLGDVEGLSVAQVGYNGAGATGDINIFASGNVELFTGGEGGYGVAQIGNGGVDASGAVGGNISITTAGGNVEVTAGNESTISQIGNLAGANGSETGNIVINTHGGDVSVSSEGGSTDPVGETSFAQIGHWTRGPSSGGSSGDITITADDVFVGVNGSFASADIGNSNYLGAEGNGAIGGNITVNAKTVTLLADSPNSGSFDEARIGNLGLNGTVTGTVKVTTTGDVEVLSYGPGAASIGNFSNPRDIDYNPIQGKNSGSVLVQAGGNVTVSASDNSSYASIENGGAASGGSVTVNATGYVLESAADGGGALIGTRVFGNGGSNVSVTSANSYVEVEATGSGSSAQLGNIEDLTSGSVNGKVTVTAANASNGSIIVHADSNSTNARIGNDGTGASGNIVLTAGKNLAIEGSLATIGNFGSGHSGSVSIRTGSIQGSVVPSLVNDITGGNFTLAITNASTPFVIGGVSYNSAYDLTVISASDLKVTGNILNAGAGNITLAAGWKPSVAPSAVLTTSGSYGVGGKSLTIGGASASGSVSVGSKSGKTNILASSLLVSAKNGNAQLGYAGAGTGGINVYTLGSVTVQTETNGTVALIGNGGYGLTGAIKGDISILAGGNVLVRTNSSSAIADIGVIGGDGSSQSGNITITAGGQVGVIAQNATSSAQIGNQQAGATTPSQRGAASGNIAITSGSVLISATGTNAGAIIGMGNTLLRNQSAAGSIIVNTGDLTISSSSTTSTGTVAMLGSRGYTSANSNIAVTASGNVSLVAGNYGNALLGQGSYGTAAGDLVVASGKTLSLNASGASSQARVGNSGVNASGNITAAASGAVTIAKASGATSLIGGSATGGTLTGNVIVLAGTAQGIAASIANDIIGGDFTLYALNSGTLDVGSVGSYSSSHDLYILAADNLAVSGSIQNSGAGNVTLAAGHTLTVGGSTASGDVAVGSKGGLTEIEATDLLLSATNGYAQIGYHGGGSGAIDVIALGNITISGGGSTGYYAQIGDGGYGVTGSSSAPISLTATSNIALNGGAGQEAYAQIGNGGAESNSNTSGYSETGDIVVSNSGAMILNAGTGQGSYVQIGNGGYLSGQSLNGTVAVGGNISVTTYSALGLTGGGDDAYVQIGNGGDFLNKNVADGSSGTISGDIAVAVQAPNVPGLDQLTLTAGTGANSYTQIGNGGQGENKPAAGAKVSFTISGNVTVADLTLSGSNTGANGYAQIGNGDASRTGTGNITGSVTLGQGTKLTYDPGKAPGASSGFGNATGQGSVSGTVASSGVDASTQGSVASITQTSTNSTTAFSVTPATASPTYVQQLASIDTIDNTKGPSPLEQLSDNSEQTTVSDTVADSVGKSLGEGKTIAVSTKMLIPGLLKQFVTLTPNQPHGVPPADVDYSSWGNEALWRW